MEHTSAKLDTTGMDIANIISDLESEQALSKTKQSGITDFCRKIMEEACKAKDHTFDIGQMTIICRRSLFLKLKEIDPMTEEKAVKINRQVIYNEVTKGKIFELDTNGKITHRKIVKKNK